MNEPHFGPFSSAQAEADAIDEKVAALKLKLQITAISEYRERSKLAEMICDAQKMAVRLRVGNKA